MIPKLTLLAPIILGLAIFGMSNSIKNDNAKTAGYIGIIVGLSAGWLVDVLIHY